MSVGWPEKPPEALVDEDLRMWERAALALRSAGQDDGAHGHRHADADRLHVRLDELHRVVDRESAYTTPPGEFT